MSISNEDVERVRSATDIVSLFSDRHVMRQRGRDFWCCCPFHDEKTPSCKVDPATQQFYCFGCHEHGDVFSYVMKSDEVEFPEAVRRLADRAGIEIVEVGRGAGVPRSYKERLRAVFAETAEFYHTQLMRGKSDEAAQARAYLGGRGLGGSVPKTWQLGFAPGRGALMRHLRAKGFTLKEMADANVVAQREGGPARDRFYNRVMFPIRDDSGAVIAFGGRVIGQGEPKYLNSQETPLFRKGSVLYGLDLAKAQVTATGCAIVVEGYTDVIALHEAGVRNVVATLGTALTRQHIRAIGRHAAKRVVYLFDGDEAGQRATDRALQFIDDSMTPEAGKMRMELLACTLPDGLDPADFVAERGVDELRARIDGAKPLIAFGIERHLSRFDTSTAEGRTAAFADCIALLAPIKDSLLAKDYAVQIAGQLHVRENDALERLAALRPPRAAQDQGAPAPAAAAGASLPAPVEPAPAPALSKAERNRRRMEAEFLGLLVHEPALLQEHAATLAQALWHEPVHAAAADALLEAGAQPGQRSAQDLAAAVTARAPQAGRLVVSGRADRENPRDYARFLSEELAIGDLSDQIDAYRAQLSSPGALSPDETELLFQTVASLQKDLARRRAAHRAYTP